MTSATEANKAVVRAFVAAWNDQEFGEFDRLMGPDAVLHVGGGDLPCTPAATRAIATSWTAAFPDWQFELLCLVAEDDRVVAHIPYSGTFTSPIGGVPATGRFARVDEIVIFRIADGRIAEAWEVYDEHGMWRQLSVAAPGHI